MKLLFDQNISYRILNLLSKNFIDSTHVKSIGLIDKNDKLIWDYAKENNYIIVTQDSDFNEFNLLFNHPPKIIWIRTGNINTKELVLILEANYDNLVEFDENDMLGCFEIVKFNK